jgi:hypothetical protein
MPKFYVSTGDCRTIVNAENLAIGSQRGFERIIIENNFPAIGLLTVVSERGFDGELDNPEDTYFIATEILIKAAGWDDCYEMCED